MARQTEQYTVMLPPALVEQVDKMLRRRRSQGGRSVLVQRLLREWLDHESRPKLPRRGPTIFLAEGL